MLASEGGASASVAALLAAHFAATAGVYWAIACMLGKVVASFRPISVSVLALALILVGILAISQLPVFGYDGHGSPKFGAIQTLFNESSSTWKRDLSLYVASVAFFMAVLFVLPRAKQRES